MKSLFKFSSLAFLVCLVYLASCTPEPLPQTDTPVQIVDIPLHKYGVLTWFPNGRIITTLEDRQLYELKDNELVPLMLELEPNDCWQVRYFQPNALPNGRLGVIRECYFEQEGREYKLDLMAFDWQDNSLEIMTPDVGYGRFSWHPDMTRGVQSIGSLNGTIQWLTSEGTQPIDLSLTSGDKTWSLATNY